MARPSLVWITASSLLVLMTAGIAFGVEPPLKPKITVSETPKWFPPQSLRDMRDAATAIARIEVLDGTTRLFELPANSGNSYSYYSQRNTATTTVRTQHKIRIVTIYKNDQQHTLTAGATTTAYQFAGRLETPDRIYVVTNEIPFKKGDDLVVFLDWNPYLFGYQVVGPFASFRIVNGKVEPLYKSDLTTPRNGIPLEQLEYEIRQR